MENNDPKIHEELSKQTLSYITAAFGLVAGLAWNEAIKSLIEFLFPADTNTILAKFIYAGFITLILVVITYYLSKVFKRK